MLARIKVRPKRPALKRRLTELTIQKAKPRASAYQIWDEKQGGLCLRVQPTGAKAWVVVYSRQGRSRWLTLGAANAIGLSDARRLAAKAMLAVAEGKDVAAEKRAERGAGTFSDLAAKYLEHAKRINKSWEQADALVRRFAIPRWGKLQASAIMRRDVRALMADITATAPILANNTLAAVSAVFSWGFGQEIVAANPAKGIARNPTRSRERVLSDSELVKFWSALDGIDSIRAAALRMILLTGQRPGEVANMRREHIKDNWWEMPGALIPGVWPGTKNKENHHIWLPKPAQDLRAAMSDSNGSTGFVFASPHGKPISKLDAAMRDVCAKLGIERATPHDLRRTFGTTITKLRLGRPAMARILNHSTNDEMGDVYDRHGYHDDDKRVMETVAARIMALVEGRAVDDNVARPDFTRVANG
jgi:integrase